MRKGLYAVHNNRVRLSLPFIYGVIFHNRVLLFAGGKYWFWTKVFSTGFLDIIDNLNKKLRKTSLTVRHIKGYQKQIE